MTLADAASSDVQSLVLSTEDFAVSATVQRATHVSDGMGGTSVSWEDWLVGLYVLIEPSRFEDVERSAGRPESQVTHRAHASTEQLATGGTIGDIAEYFQGVSGQTSLRMNIVVGSVTQTFEVRNAFRVPDGTNMVTMELVQREFGKVT